MNSKISSFIKSFFCFRYPVSLIEPAYFWIQGPKLIKWIMAFKPLSLILFEIPILRKSLFKISVNERIVENAFALSNISNFPSKILDFGSASSWLSLQLASLGHDIHSVDLRQYEFSHPKLSFFQQDIFDINLPENYFDYILIISTLEHVKTEDDKADAEVLRLLVKFLKKGGKIILTFPYGNPIILSSHRVYDKERVKKTIPQNLNIKEARYYKRESPTSWILTTEKETGKMDSSRASNGLCCLLLEKI